MGHGPKRKYFLYIADADSSTVVSMMNNSRQVGGGGDSISCVETLDTSTKSLKIFDKSSGDDMVSLCALL